MRPDAHPALSLPSPPPDVTARRRSSLLSLQVPRPCPAAYPWPPNLPPYLQRCRPRGCKGIPRGTGPALQSLPASLHPSLPPTLCPHLPPSLFSPPCRPRGCRGVPRGAGPALHSLPAPVHLRPTHRQGLRAVVHGQGAQVGRLSSNDHSGDITMVVIDWEEDGCFRGGGQCAG